MINQKQTFNLHNKQGAYFATCKSTSFEGAKKIFSKRYMSGGFIITNEETGDKKDY